MTRHALDARDIVDDIEQSEDALDEPSSGVEALQVQRLGAGEMLSLARKKRALSTADAKPVAKRSRVEAANDPVEDTKIEPTSDAEGEESVLLQVARLLADLLEGIFDSKWETRHGSLLAVRQILISSHFSASVQAGDANATDRDGDLPSSSPGSACAGDDVRKWLEESLVRCVCVLALDQFVDYSADDSVAPVRELCAQISGILLGCLHSYGSLVEILQVFRTLFDGLTWHAHHGGLLGLKFLVRAHTSHASDFISLIFDDVVGAMSTPKREEDVLVLAAGMLEDFAPHMTQVDPGKIKAAGGLLWRMLVQETDRGFVRAGAIRALSSWYQSPVTMSVLLNDESMASTAWSNLLHAIGMLHHHSESVRRSTARCVAAIANAESVFDRPSFPVFCQRFLAHLLLQLVLETKEEVTQDLLSAWKSVVNLGASSEVLAPIAAENLGQWVRFLWANEDLDCLNVEIGIPGSRVGDFAPSRQPSSSLNGDESVGWRVTFADALGFLASSLSVDDPISLSCTNSLLKVVGEGLSTTCGEMQCGCLLLLSRWALYETRPDKGTRLDRLRLQIGSTLDGFARNKWKPTATSGSKEVIHGREVVLYYEEQAKSVRRVVTMQARIVDIFSRVGIVVKKHDAKERQSPALVSAADVSRAIAEEVASMPYERLRAHGSDYEAAHFKRQDLFVVDELIQDTFARLYHRVQGLGSCAYCFLMPMPTKKSGFLVSALMDSLKDEDDAVFRSLTAEALADFVLSQAHIQKKCVAKVVSNLCNSAMTLPSGAAASTNCCSLQDPIESLPPDVMKKTQVRVAGAIAALVSICTKGGAALFTTCPALDENVSRAWTRDDAAVLVDEKTIQRSMSLMTLLSPLLEESCAAEKCMDWLEQAVTVAMDRQTEELDEASTSAHKERAHTKHVAAVAIATICSCAQSYRQKAMLVVYTRVFSVFSATGALCPQDLSAAIMVLDRVVRLLPPDSLISYIPSLVHYAMTTMASQRLETRTAAARAFAELVPLIPLQMDLGHEDYAGKETGELQTIVRENQVSRQFLESFLRGTAIQHVDVQPWLADGVALRQYQQHGVDWLVFMARNNLHGILADDMGLGKTLQTLTAMAVTLSTRSKREGIEDCKRDAVCLVVCPPIVAHHWVSEAHKCLPATFTTVVDYSGSANERRVLRKEAQRRDGAHTSSRCVLIVTTYAVVRSDEDGFLAGQEFDYVVLDEAHLIRNPATALFRSVQQLHASHRLALSGTPLQNHVGDLWSLFEFLMPGYLGDFASFRRDFVLPIAKSKERNATAKQKEVAAIAIAQLHQKVLPFILRRTKDQVLQELPPKTISNVLLPLSSIQQRLYALASSPKDCDEQAATSARAAHVFTDLQILRRICVHPSLVLNERFALDLNSNQQQAAQKWSASGKLLGLRDLLVEVCDVGGKGGDDTDEFELQPHRCLVFAHLHETLDLTEQMLADALPRVSFRRLDGRTPPANRASIVRQFNEDPSIDLLLLTTAVGGLGLTLTGADTVIFLEHSWNPFVDLQAMDRAHRIGQRRAVRVFRLIMQNSLEEHIMNLQAFKQGVADTVVKQQGDAHSGMNASTKGVLALLQSSSAVVTAKEAAASVGGSQTGHDAANFLPGAAKELLEEIGDLWDESQYESLAFPDGE